MLRVPPEQLVALAPGRQPVGGVLAHNVQQEEPDAGIRLGPCGDEALLGQGGDDPRRPAGVEATRPVRAHRGRRFDGEATDEHSQPSEDGPLLVAEVLEAPVDGAGDRLLPGRYVAWRAHREVDGTVDPVEKHLGREQSDGRGRQFDRQGHAVERGADGRDGAGVVDGDGEVRLHQSGAGQEESQRRPVGRRARWRERLRVREGERRDGVAGFAGKAEGFSAGGQHLHSGRGGQDLAEK